MMDKEVLLLTAAERIKAVRKAQEPKLSQTEFGEKLGVSRGVVNNLELGRVEPTELMIRSIARTFNVDEVWLRTGAGTMEVQATRKENIAAFFHDLRGDDDDSFRVRLVSALAELNEDEWALLADMAEKLVKEQKNNPDE